VDVLWSPWRYDYIKASGPRETTGCVFCDILKNSVSDEENFILKRAEFNFVILNIYPYTSGHMMVIPYDHVALLSDARKVVTDEMMELVRSSESALTAVYKPDGINLGMNLGRAAGAGVDGHFHMHILPRWVGDVNFLTAIGQTRSLPESLPDTYDKLREYI